MLTGTTSDRRKSEKKRPGFFPEEYENQPPWDYDPRLQPQPDYVPNTGCTPEIMKESVHVFLSDLLGDRKDQKSLERLQAERQSLERLQAERQAKINELKEKTNYSTTQQIILRYDPGLAAKKAAALVLASKEVADSGLKVYLGDESKDDPLAGKSNDVEFVQASGIRHHKPSHSKSSSTGSAGLQHIDEKLLPDSGNATPGSLKHDQLVVEHHNPGSTKKDGGRIARVAAMLVGENPTHGYALICGNCHMHNGLARREDFPYVIYYCPNCNVLNRSKHLEGAYGSDCPSLSSSIPENNINRINNTSSDTVRDMVPASSSSVAAAMEKTEVEGNESVVVGDLSPSSATSPSLPLAATARPGSSLVQNPGESSKITTGLHQDDVSITTPDSFDSFNKIQGSNSLVDIEEDDLLKMRMGTTSDWGESEKKRPGFLSEEYENQPPWECDYDLRFQPQPDYVPNTGCTPETMTESDPLEEYLKQVVCKICLKKGEHLSNYCPYKEFAPKGAIIGDAASLVCYCCGVVNGHPDRDNWTGHAALKFCFKCGKHDDHWTEMCKEEKELMTKGLFISADEPSTVVSIKAL